MTSSSYDSGRISCTFSRSVLAENFAEDRNLNESAYLLLAIGSQRGKAQSITLGYAGYGIMLYRLTTSYMYGEVMSHACIIC